MEEPQTEQKPTQEWAKGWIIISAIIIIAAVILYMNGRNDSNENEDDNTNQQVVTPTYEVKDVPLTITLSVPKSITAGTIFGIDWDIQAEEQTAVEHTVIHWDTTSRPGEFGLDVDDEASGYSQKTVAFDIGSFLVPAGFEDNIKIEDALTGQVIYLRAHAVLLGKNYWSDEVAIPIKAFPTEGTERK